LLTITIFLACIATRAASFTVTLFITSVLKVKLDFTKAVDFLAALFRLVLVLAQVVRTRTQWISVLFREEVKLGEQSIHHSRLYQLIDHFGVQFESFLDKE